MNFTAIQKSPWLFPALLFALALLLRMGAWVNDPCISRDGVLYLEMAQRMAEISPSAYYEEHPLTWAPPLYPQLIVWGIRLGLPAECSGVLPNLLAGAGMVVLFFLALRRLAPESMLPCYAALGAAFAPCLLHLSTECQREMSYGFFIALFFYCAVRYVQDGSLWSIGCAAAASLGYCARVEAVELFAAFPLIALLKLYLRRSEWKNAGSVWPVLKAFLGPLLLFLGGVLLFTLLEIWIFGLPWSFVQRQIFRWSCRLAGWC